MKRVCCVLALLICLAGCRQVQSEPGTVTFVNGLEEPITELYLDEPLSGAANGGYWLDRYNERELEPGESLALPCADLPRYHATEFGCDIGIFTESGKFYEAGNVILLAGDTVTFRLMEGTREWWAFVTSADGEEKRYPVLHGVAA